MLGLSRIRPTAHRFWRSDRAVRRLRWQQDAAVVASALESRLGLSANEAPRHAGIDDHPLGWASVSGSE